MVIMVNRLCGHRQPAISAGYPRGVVQEALGRLVCDSCFVDLREGESRAILMTPSDIFRALTPDQIAAYLTAHGWREDPDRWGPDPGWRAAWVAWFCTAHDPPHETECPREDHWIDWPRRVTECLIPVAACEERPSPALQVARDVASAVP